MAFQVVPHTAQVNIRYTREGQLIENVIHVSKASGSFSESELAAIAGVVNTQVPTNWMPKMPSNVVYQETNVIDISVEGGSQVTQSVVGGQPGSIGGTPLPNNVSLAVRLRSGIGGRHGSGRIYWPGFAAGQLNTANTVNPPEIVDIIAAIQDLIDALNAIGAIVTIVSRFLDKVKRPEGVPFVVNTVSVFDNTIDAQRRRLPGRGT